MRAFRFSLPLLTALLIVAAPARNASAGPQKDAVCQGSCGGGCGPCGGSSSYSSGGGMSWGHMTSRNLAQAQRDCGNPLCLVFQSVLGIAAGAVTDAPYYAVKGVGYGVYYGGIGLGKGLIYTGKAIGRGIAYPFNRPPKPVVPPTSWEQYKHDVLRYQKRLTKANKANKENQLWCAGHVPLAVSAGRSAWEARCNAGDAISRSALPAEIMSAPPVPAPAEAVAAPAVAVAAPTPEAAAPMTGMNATATTAPETPLAKPVEAAATPLAQAPTAGDPVSAPAQPATDPAAPIQAPAAEPAPAPSVAPQQVVQTGVAPSVAALNGAAPAAPAPMPASGSVYRPLPTGTPANSLTPSEYGFEGRGGYAARYEQVWGKETAADEFIAKWNVMGPINTVQKAVRETSVRKGITYVKENYLLTITDSVLEAYKRIRGATGIAERLQGVQEGGSVVAKFHHDVLDSAMDNITQAAKNGDSDAAAANLEKESDRNDALREDAEKLWMGQVRDPMQLKELTIEQTKAKLDPTKPEFASIREKIFCHIADPMGIGCSKSKLVYSPPR